MATIATYQECPLPVPLRYAPTIRKRAEAGDQHREPAAEADWPARADGQDDGQRSSSTSVSAIARSSTSMPNSPDRSYSSAGTARTAAGTSSA